MAIPSPLVAAHTPIALRRSPGSRNMSVMIDRVDGIIIAAPTPIPARAAMSIPVEPEYAAHADVPPNTARPVTNTRRRPNRSALLPATSISPAKTRA